MVICQYNLNNSCRFGPKCHNEHVNVKLTLKTDAEGALKGNQWPLSCYGPFRDKPCIQNFIEDQSFEEFRLLCYEAKASGNVQMVTNQFTQSALDAKNKMNMLTNPADEVVLLVTNLYNNSCTNAPAQNTATNPFGMGSNSMNTGGNNVFGGAVSSANTNLFGSSSVATNSNPFARNAAGFGATPQNQSTNLFGGSSNTPNSMNLFGGASNPPNSGTSLFGGSSFSNTNISHTNQSSSIFGGGNPTSGPFSQQNTNSSPFALPAATNQNNLFGGGQQQQQQQPPSNPIFGGGASFGSQVKTGLFGQTSATLTQPSNPGNIFGQNVQQPFGAQTQANLFGGGSQNQSQSIFGGAGGQQMMQNQDNPFAAVAQSATTNIFGGAQMQQQQQQQQQASPFQNVTSSFGANMTTNTGQPIFGVANQAQTNLMAQANPMAQPQVASQTLQQQQQNIFGSNSFSVPQQAQTPFGGNMFQNAQDPQESQTQPMYGGQTQQNTNPFGSATVATVVTPIQQSKTLYTPMDLLSQDEIEAFNSNTFDITKIPTKPPPMELCT